jgi:uncharacterized membrane protein
MQLPPQGVSFVVPRFTNPAVVAILLSGMWLALLGCHTLLGTGWMPWPIVLFSFSGFTFMFRVAVAQ